ncbi:MAG TPA: phosphoglycerate dehydrogenase, partial [Syntrophorhabdus aromaticivorans]|nr:phosphoglycerate dehydrogenase [Syntrophorhabdus aromaticivorans]
MERFKVLVTDNVSEEGVAILNREEDIDIDVRAGIKNDELKKIVGEYDAIITRSGTTVTADLIENPGKLK